MDRMSVCDERNNNIILKKVHLKKVQMFTFSWPKIKANAKRIENSVSFTVNLHRRKASFGFHPLLLPLSVV